MFRAFTLTGALLLGLTLPTIAEAATASTFLNIRSGPGMAHPVIYIAWPGWPLDREQLRPILVQCHLSRLGQRLGISPIYHPVGLAGRQCKVEGPASWPFPSSSIVGRGEVSIVYPVRLSNLAAPFSLRLSSWLGQAWGVRLQFLLTA